MWLKILLVKLNQYIMFGQQPGSENFSKEKKALEAVSRSK